MELFFCSIPRSLRRLYVVSLFWTDTVNDGVRDSTGQYWSLLDVTVIQRHLPRDEESPMFLPLLVTQALESLSLTFRTVEFPQLIYENLSDGLGST